MLLLLETASRSITLPIHLVNTVDGQKVDVSILLLLTNRHNKGILLHFCQQNGKKNSKTEDFDKTSWKWPEQHFGTKHFLVPRPK